MNTADNYFRRLGEKMHGIESAVSNTLDLADKPPQLSEIDSQVHKEIRKLLLKVAEKIAQANILNDQRNGLEIKRW